MKNAYLSANDEPKMRDRLKPGSKRSKLLLIFDDLTLAVGTQSNHEVQPGKHFVIRQGKNIIRGGVFKQFPQGKNGRTSVSVDVVDNDKLPADAIVYRM